MQEEPQDSVEWRVPKRITRKERTRMFLESWEADLREAEAGAEPDLRTTFGELPRLPLWVIGLQMNKQINHGGLIRLAEAYRLERLTFEREAETLVELSGSRGARDWMPWSIMPPEEALAQAKGEGRMVVGLALNDRAMPIGRVPWRFPAAIVLGEERRGLRPEIEAMCDVCAAIPLYGMTTSLNVTHAAVIAVHEAAGAYIREHPEFLPARKESLRLVSPDQSIP